METDRSGNFSRKCVSEGYLQVPVFLFAVLKITLSQSEKHILYGCSVYNLYTICQQNVNC